jgi:hypothetical protein
MICLDHTSNLLSVIKADLRYAQGKELSQFYITCSLPTKEIFVSSKNILIHRWAPENSYEFLEIKPKRDRICAVSHWLEAWAMKWTILQRSILCLTIFLTMFTRLPHSKVVLNNINGTTYLASTLRNETASTYAVLSGCFFLNVYSSKAMHMSLSYWPVICMLSRLLLKVVEHQSELYSSLIKF